MGRPTEKPVEDTQAGFAGGLNLTSDQAFLRPDQARVMQNARLHAYGAALKRLGTLLTSSAAITTNATTNDQLGGIYWPLQQKAYVFCAATNSTAVHVYRSQNDLPSAMTWSDLGAIPQWRPVIFSDGTNEVMYVAGDATQRVQKIAVDGVSISALGASTAEVDGLVVYNDRLWGWHNNSLYYSNLSSTLGSTGGDSLGDASAGGGVIIIRTFAASNITGCFVVNGVLEIHHVQGISVLTGWGQDDIQVQPQALNSILGTGWSGLGFGVGNNAGDSGVVANIEGQGDICYFMTPQGAYASNASTIHPLGSPEKPDPLQQLLLDGTIAPTWTSVTFNRRYNEVWFQVRGVGVYVYNVSLTSWSGPFIGSYAFPLMSFYFPVPNVTGRPALWRVGYSLTAAGVFVIESDTTSIYKDDVTPNGGTGTGGRTVTLSLQCHRMFAGDRVFSKSWRWLNLLATLVSGGTPPTVAFTTDLGGTNTLTLSSLTSVETAYYLSPGGLGPFLDVTITDVMTTGVSQYALATVQGNSLGQR